jgi:hypothetical protein
VNAAIAGDIAFSEEAANLDHVANFCEVAINAESAEPRKVRAFDNPAPSPSILSYLEFNNRMGIHRLITHNGTG